MQRGCSPTFQTNSREPIPRASADCDLPGRVRLYGQRTSLAPLTRAVCGEKIDPCLSSCHDKEVRTRPQHGARRIHPSRPRKIVHSAESLNALPLGYAYQPHQEENVCEAPHSGGKAAYLSLPPSSPHSSSPPLRRHPAALRTAACTQKRSRTTPSS